MRRSMSQVPGREPFTKEPKTGQQRTIGIPESLVQELTQHREEQLRFREAAGDTRPDEGWICTHPDGRHITPNALTRGFMRLRDKAGTPISFHGLRHTLATELLMAGVPVRTVSEVLGHANSSVTLDIYGHVLPRSRQHAADLAGAMMERLRLSTNPASVQKSVQTPDKSPG